MQKAKTGLTARFWLALVLFSLVGQVAWVVENMYLNVFIYKMFRATAGDISAMVAASAVAATVTTILMGALSDRVGKRRVFMCRWCASPCSGSTFSPRPSPWRRPPRRWASPSPSCSTAS